MNIILVEALTFGLGRLTKAAEELNVTLHLLTRNPDVYFYELKNIQSKRLKVVKLDTFDKKEVINYCSEIDNFANIINLTDTWTNTVREVSEILGCKIQNPLSMKICRDKSMLRQTLIEKKLSRCSQNLVDIRQEKINLEGIRYPVIVKDASGTGSKNVWLAESTSELYKVISEAKSISNLDQVLVETYLKGTLFSAETVSYQGKTKLISISSRILSDIPKFMEKAISLPLKTKGTELENVEPWIKHILTAISYTDGFAHTEFVVTDKGFEVIEVNPRLGGVQIGEALCQAFDYNFYKAFIEMALGREPEVFSIQLSPKKAIGQVFIYANSTGRFSHTDNKHTSKKTTVYPCAIKGKKINSLSDQTSCVAISLTESSNSELALLDALSEANKIKVFMD
ncbi:ATP-grasp domain-containing protein [Candidatus Sororendozoicomonas aggregata]|uniref:ATP-grasp domain-containing protein n=1 Tax=Candidatus Sororendozoicomonas aggregata TaxID=3073239 RepID=UPI002ED57FF6